MTLGGGPWSCLSAAEVPDQASLSNQDLHPNGDHRTMCWDQVFCLARLPCERHERGKKNTVKHTHTNTNRSWRGMKMVGLPVLCLYRLFRVHCIQEMKVMWSSKLENGIRDVVMFSLKVISCLLRVLTRDYFEALSKQGSLKYPHIGGIKESKKKLAILKHLPFKMHGFGLVGFISEQWKKGPLVVYIPQLYGDEIS